MTIDTDRLRQVFGLTDERGPISAQVVRRVQTTANCLTEELMFDLGAGETTRAFWCRPAASVDRAPAVLVIHAHGNHYDIGATELTQGRPALFAPTGPALAARGIASLCLDMPCFGSRAGQTEMAASKAALWEGRVLAGQMLAENMAAVAWLAARPDVRADRIGLFGMSMGATLSYWLAALDSRIRAVAQECCLADFRQLIALGRHDLHGIYLTVPGLLPVAANGEIGGMIAPRAQFIGLGDQDPLTPPLAADIAVAQVQAAYARAGGRLILHREPASGHVETAAMHGAMLDFFSAELA